MQYYSVRPRKGNTIFVDNSGVSVDRAYVAKAIKQLVSKVGEDPVGYLHALTARGACFRPSSSKRECRDNTAYG